MSVKTWGQDWEHIEAVRDEVQPLLWHLEDLTGEPFVGVPSERSTVAGLLTLDDGRLLNALRERLGIPIDYRDTLVQVVRRFRRHCVADLV